jgi:glycosyltransferase involved in cell wall biosynthesis
LSRQKILILRSSAGVFGAERVVLELCKGLMDSPYQPVVGVLTNQDKRSIHLYEAARLENLPAEVFEAGGAFDRGAILQIREYIEANEVSIINCHGYKANVYAAGAAAFAKKILIATIHPWTETEYSWRAKFYTWLDKLVLRMFDERIAVSDNVLKMLKSQMPAARHTLIPNGIDTSRFLNIGAKSRQQMRRLLNIPEDCFLIGTIGRFAPEKGYELFLEAAKQVREMMPNTRFVIVGDGELRETLVEKAAQFNLLEVLTFTGVRTDIPELLSAMDIYVLSSFSEGLPMVVLEAMATGKAVVATSVGDIPKLIQHNKTGVLVPPHSASALATALVNLLSQSELIQRLGIAAQRFVCENYDFKKMTQKYIERFNYWLQQQETHV